MVKTKNIASVSLPDSDLVKKLTQTKTPAAINFELTARCNNACRHCYINLPENDSKAQSLELSFTEIENLAAQAINSGVLWCLITGGEPLLRDDFADVYIMLKKKGLLVSVFTNGCLINDRHIEVFKKYRPRELEVTVYGISEKTYEQVTGVKGSYRLFKNGLDLLFKNNIHVSLKAMAIRTNVHEIEAIADFCAKYSRKKFRFDPFLQLRHDRNVKRNKLIRKERLNKDEVVLVEQNNLTRKNALLEGCDKLIFNRDPDNAGKVFTCGILKNGFEISFDGKLRLCSSLLHPDYVRDVRKMSLLEAYREIADKIAKARSASREFDSKCGKCRIPNLCYFCPATSYLETGKLTVAVDSFCETAHARQEALLEWKKTKPPGH